MCQVLAALGLEEVQTFSRSGCVQLVFHTLEANTDPSHGRAAPSSDVGPSTSRERISSADARALLAALARAVGEEVVAGQRITLQLSSTRWAPQCLVFEPTLPSAVAPAGAEAVRTTLACMHV